LLKHNHEGKRQREENREHEWKWPHLDSTLPRIGRQRQPK